MFGSGDGEEGDWAVAVAVAAAVGVGDFSRDLVASSSVGTTFFVTYIRYMQDIRKIVKTVYLHSNTVDIRLWQVMARRSFFLGGGKFVTWLLLNKVWCFIEVKNKVMATQLASWQVLGSLSQNEHLATIWFHPSS